MDEDPCYECLYWPIYPVADDDNTIVDCLAVYNNDGISCGTHVYMFEELLK